MRLVLLCLALVGAAVMVAAAPSWTITDTVLANAYGVSFVDTKVGYVVGGSAFRTKDGGVLWEEVPDQEDTIFTSAATIDYDSAVLAGIDLLVTTDGNTFTDSSAGAFEVKWSQDVQRITGADSFAVVGPFTGPTPGETYNVVAISKDNGATYECNVITVGDIVRARFGAFPSTSVGFVAFGTVPLQIPSGPTATRIYRSTDSFQTWQSIYMNSTFYPNSIACASPKVCFFTGQSLDAGFLMRTTDGGETWEELLHTPEIFLRSVQVISEDELFVSGSSNVYHSTDGGASWEIKAFAAEISLISTSFVDANHGWAVAMNSSTTTILLTYA